jgi:hypothetical protein
MYATPDLIGTNFWTLLNRKESKRRQILNKKKTFDKQLNN